MGFIWGLISALSYGSSDFIAREVSIRLTPYRALFYIQLVSGVLLFMVVVIDEIPTSMTAGSIGLATLLGLVNMLATLFLYRALAVGKISIVSPVISTFGGVTLVLSLLAGDSISPGGIFSLVLMLVGVVVVSIVPDDSPQEGERAVIKGLPEAVISALTFGLYFWGIQFVVGPLEAYVPALIGRLVTIILLLLFSRLSRSSIAAPPRTFWLKIGASGLISTIGEVAYNVGVQGTTPGIVAVLSSLFSPVTVLLALIFLRERLARHQWFGVGVIFIATLLIGIFQNFG